MDQLLHEDSIRSASIIRNVCTYLTLDELLELNEEYRACQEVRKYFSRRVKGMQLYYPLGYVNRTDETMVCLFGPNLTSAEFSVTDDGDRQPLKRMMPTKIYDNESHSWQNTASDKSAFGQCTDLTVDFDTFAVESRFTTAFILRHLLCHFPAVKSLTLRGYHFPLLSCLPRPDELKHLQIILHKRRQTPQYTDTPVLVNFNQLETLYINYHNDSVYQQMITPAEEDKHEITRRTGVRWLESMKRYPPTCLHEIQLHCLTAWGVALLASSGCRSRLVLSSLGPQDVDHIRDLLKWIVDRGGPMLRVTHLKILRLQSGEALSAFIGMMPFLRKLEVDISRRTPLPHSDNIHGSSWEEDVKQSWLDHIRSITLDGLELRVNLVY